MKKTKTMMAVALAAVLSACGGSDGDDVPSLAQYAGTWRSPCVTINGKLSGQTVLLVRSNSDTVVRAAWVPQVYNNPSCAGAPANSGGYSMEVTAVGTRETASGLASRVEFRPFATSSTETVPGPRGELMLLKDGRLYLGDQTNIAADGYPADVDLSISWTR